MRRTLIDVAGAAAVVISAGELAELGLVVGDPVDVHVRAGVLELRPVNKYAELSMADLLAHIEKHRTRK